MPTCVITNQASVTRSATTTRVSDGTRTPPPKRADRPMRRPAKMPTTTRPAAEGERPGEDDVDDGRDQRARQRERDGSRHGPVGRRGTGTLGVGRRRSVAVRRAVARAGCGGGRSPGCWVIVDAIVRAVGPATAALDFGPVSHPSLGLPPVDFSAAHPAGADRLRAQRRGDRGARPRSGRRARSDAADAIRRSGAAPPAPRHRRLPRSDRAWPSRAGETGFAAEWTEWCAPLYRRRGVPHG